MTLQEAALLSDRYRLQRSTSCNDVADVYLAFDKKRQAPVAVKILREDLAEDPVSTPRYCREAEALARLNYPNTVHFYASERTNLWRAVWVAILGILILGIAVQKAQANQISLPPTADTFVASGLPDQHFEQDRGLWVGYDQAGGRLNERSLLNFVPSTIPPGSQITSANLWMYLAGTTTNDNPITVQAYRVLGPWVETITWQNHLVLAIDSAPIASTSVPATLDWVSWDVTAALQAWSDTRTTDDFSLILISNVLSGTHIRGFWSRDCSIAECGNNRPRLDVVYDRPGPTLVYMPLVSRPRK